MGSEWRCQGTRLLVACIHPGPGGANLGHYRHGILEIGLEGPLRPFMETVSFRTFLSITGTDGF